MGGNWNSQVQQAAAGGGGYQNQGAIAQLREQSALQQSSPLYQLQLMNEQAQIKRAQQTAAQQQALLKLKIGALGQQNQSASAFDAVLAGSPGIASPSASQPPMPGQSSVPMQQAQQQPGFTGATPPLAQNAQGAGLALIQGGQSQPQPSPMAGQPMPQAPQNTGNDFLSDPKTMKIIQYGKNAGLQPAALNDALQNWFQIWKEQKSLQRQSDAEVYRQIAADNKMEQAKQQQSDIKEVAQGVKDGDIPPTLPGMYGKKAAVLSELEKQGFDVSKAISNWNAAQKQISSMNGPQMVRFNALGSSVMNTIDEVQALAKQMQNSGIPALNSAKIATYIQGEGNSENGQMAARYQSAVNTLKEEFANLAQGGYAPTESAWKQADSVINGNYGVYELGSSLDEAKKLINIRLNGLKNATPMGVGGGANPYAQPNQNAPTAGGNAPSGDIPSDIQAIMSKYGQ